MFLLTLRVVLGLRQVRFFRGWVRLELNMLIFLGIIRLTKMGIEVARIKYFIIQRIGSSLLLRGIRLSLVQSSRLLITGVMATRLLLKMGMAPLHL